jgi:hypothetical protein
MHKNEEKLLLTKYIRNEGMCLIDNILDKNTYKL